jgi:hypothetical protein
VCVCVCVCVCDERIFTVHLQHTLSSEMRNGRCVQRADVQQNKNYSVSDSTGVMQATSIAFCEV